MKKVKPRQRQDRAAPACRICNGRTLILRRTHGYVYVVCFDCGRAEPRRVQCENRT